MNIFLALITDIQTVEDLIKHMTDFWAISAGSYLNNKVQNVFSDKLNLI